VEKDARSVRPLWTATYDGAMLVSLPLWAGTRGAGGEQMYIPIGIGTIILIVVLIALLS
jgi:hypothetical protein